MTRAFDQIFLRKALVFIVLFGAWDANAQAIPTPKNLPSFYGIYALDGSKVVELDEFDSTVKLDMQLFKRLQNFDLDDFSLLLHSPTAKLNSGDEIKLLEVFFYKSLTYKDSFSVMEEQIIDINEYDLNTRISEIPIKIAPVPNQDEMLILKPQLNDGVYFLFSEINNTFALFSVGDIEKIPCYHLTGNGLFGALDNITKIESCEEFELSQKEQEQPSLQPIETGNPCDNLEAVLHPTLYKAIVNQTGEDGVSCQAIQTLKKLVFSCVECRFSNDEPITDLTGLEYATSLEELRLVSHNIVDIEPIQTLTKLRVLDLSNNEITSIEPLRSLVNLEDLDIGNNRLIDISPLSELRNLKQLRLGLTLVWESYGNSNTIADFSPLENLSNLELLDVSDSGVKELSFLPALSKLKVLNLSFNPIVDVTVISFLEDLEELDLKMTNVTVVRPLSKLSKLRRLNLNKVDIGMDDVLLSEIDESIVDIDSLESLPLLKDLSYYTVAEYRAFREEERLRYATGNQPALSKIEPLKRIEAHASRVSFIAQHLNLTMLASASEDASIKFWDATSGAAMGTLIGHRAWVNGIAFSPDGSLLASASDDKTVRIWDAKSGVELYSLLGHTDWVGSVAFHPSGRYLVSAGGDSVIKVWDLESKIQVREFIGHEGYVRAFFNADGSKLVSASGDKTVRVWDFALGDTIKTFTGHTEGVLFALFNPDGSKVASASGDGTVRQWDVASGALLAVLTGHEGKVVSLAYSAGGDLLYSAAEDGFVYLWDANSFERLGQFGPHSDRVLSIIATPSGSVISGTADGELYFW